MFNGWYEFYKEDGIKLIMVIGQDQNQNSNIGADYAQAYLSNHGYSEGVIGAIDPDWQAMTANVAPAGNALPYFAMLDGEMNIMGADMQVAQITAALEQLTGKALPMTCEGACGGGALGGCYCDAACVGYGDCCPDACDYCDINCP